MSQLPTPGPMSPTTHYGFFISLPAREWFLMEMSRMPAERKIDIAIAYGAEVKYYTFDEFMLLLGFNSNPVPRNQEEITR